MVKIVILRTLWPKNFEVEFEYHLLLMDLCLILFRKGGMLVMAFKRIWGKQRVNPYINIYICDNPPKYHPRIKYMSTESRRALHDYFELARPSNPLSYNRI
jgi:hypothetical protein